MDSSRSASLKPRPRANHSCEHCHFRKVRCDVNTFGAPCTNCQLDGRQCAKRAPLKRGRKSRLGRVPPVDHPGETQGANHDDRIEDALDLHTDLVVNQLPLHSAPQAVPHVAHVFVPFYYHDYLQRIDIRHLSPSQVQLLEDQGCLKVPSGAALQAFIRNYFLYVHPCLPILNEADFWSMYSGEGCDVSHDRRFSLALFQAMLFAASRFVPAQVIAACGFDCIKHARTIFHRRAELLLENRVDKDPLTVAQTSLLLSLQSTILDQSLNSAWLTKAIYQAKLAGAPNYHNDSNHTLTEESMERKKLWWCCVLRDRMIAVGVRRHAQIMLDDFDVAQAGLEEDDFANEQHKSLVYDSDTKSILAKIIVAQCELAVGQTTTMIIAYDDSSLSGVLSMSELLNSMTAIERARTELDVWSRRYMRALTTYSNDFREAKGSSTSVALFAEMTLIHYYSTLVALSNHELAVLEQHQSQFEDYLIRLEDLKTQLRTWVENVADRVQRLSEQGLVHHLPISAPACTALPFVLEALNLRLSTASKKSRHRKQLEDYTKIMSTFRAQHDVTECVTTAVDGILRVVEPEINQLLIRSDAETPGSSSVTTDSPSSIITVSRPSTWLDMLANDPLLYLRLSLFLDLALSRGKTPHVTDLPIWTLGNAATLHAPMLSSSLNLMSPSGSRGMLLGLEQSRFVELGDHGEPVMTEQNLVPPFDPSTVIDYQMPWSFVDMDVVAAWFNTS